MAGLDQLLESLVQACTPTLDDHNKRVSLIERIQRSLHRVGHVENLRVIPYGSFVSQFYTSTSDLDLAICGTYPLQRLKPGSRADIFHGGPEGDVSLHKLDRRTKAQLLREVGGRLLGAGLARRNSVEYILHARVPIVKFVDPVTGIEVDLCLGNADTGFKAWSVAQVASIHPAFGKLFRVVKVWAKAHSINDGASHMFNSWCLTLVVMSFLQTYPEPPLLPPLHELLYDSKPDMSSPRLMQGGNEFPPQVYEIMSLRTKMAQELYGSRPCKPVDQLFREFVENGGRKLRSLLAREGSFLRDTRVSAFYGEMLTRRPFASDYVLCVEDPYDDTDNTARTLGTWEGHPGTIHYITSVFERTLRHLSRHVAATCAGSDPGGPAAKMKSSAASGRVSNDGGDAASSASASSSSSSVPPSLASTAVFLFGTELLSRLPELSERLLGPGLCGWARGALAAGRPAGEVHQELLARLGAEQEFVSFESFKRRHGIKVHNEAKYATPEEKAAAAAQEAARRAAKKAREVEKRSARKARDAAQGSRDVAAQVSGVHPHQQVADDGCAEATAAAAVTAALGGKQQSQANDPDRERDAGARAQRKPRSSAAGVSSEENLPGTSPPAPAPRAPLRMPQRTQQQLEQQPRARLSSEARAVLAKALGSRSSGNGLESVGPGPGSLEATRPPPPPPPPRRRESGRSSSDGTMAATAVAAAAADTAPRRTPATGEAVSTGGGGRGPEASAAAAGAPGAAGASQQRQNDRGLLHEGVAAGEQAASMSADRTAIQQAMQGLMLGSHAKEKGPKAQQQQQPGGRGASCGGDTGQDLGVETPGAQRPRGRRRRGQRRRSSEAEAGLPPPCT
ncbi:hypothetical protein PLESTB_001763300 [Pleodorina starrii]|uniref:Poly(A) RNA polymerase mitochondrial-like central palm domain-containing protein n=1 Tax=Pleodorina starrii TaxID=330485 RepID=A0A9W6FAB2_9CHLO|nr:hypothetical protein PLESTM_002094300 [Pleodorina starrii]GLC61501.1 hypothetical protein PLESTB_001763300 [Pleodorina starrii]GLC77327.1 hypothetical protein PLESTF_001920000 [Pleodorina starrii]